jgi:hypothetical protein
MLIADGEWKGDFLSPQPWIDDATIRVYHPIRDYAPDY